SWVGAGWGGGRFAALVGLLPLVRFRDRRANPQRQQRRQDADEKQVPPGLGAERADIEPYKGGEEVADADAALHEAGAAAAGVSGPQLGHHRRTGRPFRAARNGDEEAQNRERYPIERDRREPGRDRVG